jgi:hypothetical protein
MDRQIEAAGEFSRQAKSSPAGHSPGAQFARLGHGFFILADTVRFTPDNKCKGE